MMNAQSQDQKNASSHQEGGDHYAKMQQDMQPWNVLSHWLTPEEYRGYQKGVAIAYLAREGSKGGDMDIRKAIHHLQRLVEEFPAKQPVFPPIIAPEVNADKAEVPHAELRKSYRPGQRWQNSWAGRDAWNDLLNEPGWDPAMDYRRHPDCTWKEPEAEDPHAEMRKIYKLGMRWRGRGNGLAWSPWYAEPISLPPSFFPGSEYEIHPDDLPKPEEKPWVPDDSGEWVEVPDDLMEMPKELEDTSKINVLLRAERRLKNAMAVVGASFAADWKWNDRTGSRIVAYKVVKP